MLVLLWSASSIASPGGESRCCAASRRRAGMRARGALVGQAIVRRGRTYGLGRTERAGKGPVVERGALAPCCGRCCDAAVCEPGGRRRPRTAKNKRGRRLGRRLEPTSSNSSRRPWPAPPALAPCLVLGQRKRVDSQYGLLIGSPSTSLAFFDCHSAGAFEGSLAAPPPRLVAAARPSQDVTTGAQALAQPQPPLSRLRQLGCCPRTTTTLEDGSTSRPFRPSAPPARAPVLRAGMTTNSKRFSLSNLSLPLSSSSQGGGSGGGGTSSRAASPNGQLLQLPLGSPAAQGVSTDPFGSPRAGEPAPSSMGAMVVQRDELHKQLRALECVFLPLSLSCSIGAAELSRVPASLARPPADPVPSCSCSRRTRASSRRWPRPRASSQRPASTS